MTSLKLFLTGVTGFIGGAVLKQLSNTNHDLTVLSRSPVNFGKGTNRPQNIVGDLSDTSTYTEGLQGVDVVIHIAAKAHSAGISLEQFRVVNTDATISLAKAAAASGVKRFIFLSSIGVNGLSTVKPFTAEDKPAPQEDYAISKLEAELSLKQLALDTEMEIVIIRPPLVYGSDAPGNFGKLLKLARKSFPLPLGAIQNKRSLIALDNLVDLIATCIHHPKAGNQTFLASDDMDISTAELLTLLRSAVGKKAMLVPIPFGWLLFVAKLVGKASVIERLCGNLQVDITHTKEVLRWSPPLTIEEGIRRCFAEEDLS